MYVFVMSGLDYGNALLAGLSLVHLKKLPRIQEEEEEEDEEYFYLTLNKHYTNTGHHGNP